MESANPWDRPCDAVGPYAIPHRTAKTMAYRVVHCTRPANHGDDFHQSTDRAGMLNARWLRDGTPVWPHVIGNGRP